MTRSSSLINIHPRKKQNYLNYHMDQLEKNIDSKIESNIADSKVSKNTYYNLYS